MFPLATAHLATRPRCCTWAASTCKHISMLHAPLQHHVFRHVRSSPRSTRDTAHVRSNALSSHHMPHVHQHISTNIPAFQTCDAPTLPFRHTLPGDCWFLFAISERDFGFRGVISGRGCGFRSRGHAVQSGKRGGECYSSAAPATSRVLSYTPPTRCPVLT